MDREPIYEASLPSGEQISFFSFGEIKSSLEDEQKDLHSVISGLNGLGLKPSRELMRHHRELNELIGHAKRLSMLPAVSGDMGKKFLSMYRHFMSAGEQSADRYAGRGLAEVSKQIGQGRLSGVGKKISQILGLSSAYTDTLSKQDEDNDHQQQFVSELVKGTNWDSDPWLGELKNRTDSNKDNIDSLRQLVRANELKNEQLSNEVKALRKETQDHIGQAQAVVEKAENAHSALQEKLRLQEASKYWTGEEGKQKKHTQRFRWFLGALVAWLGLSGITLWKTLADYKLKVEDAETIYDLVPHLPTNLLLILLAVWIARILVRLVLSENHLATRAEEKGILIQTYLALVDQGAAKTEDRAIILGSIFSHTQDGLVEDDGMPNVGVLSSATKSN